MVHNKYDLTDSKWFGILISSLKRVGNKNKKKGSVMNKQIKINIVRVLKVGALASFLSIAVYLGIPKLTLNEVLSLLSLVVGFALAFTFIKQ